MKWIDFMDELCMLQLITLPADLTEAQKVALFLNLYHLLVLHGTLVIGPPVSWVSWPAFFRAVSYKIGGQILSISELEYFVIR